MKPKNLREEVGIYTPFVTFDGELFRMDQMEKLRVLLERLFV